MAKNIISTVIDQVQDPKTREALQYIIAELDRIKSLPPVNHDVRNIATIVNKITRNL